MSDILNALKKSSKRSPDSEGKNIYSSMQNEIRDLKAALSAEKEKTASLEDKMKGMKSGEIPSFEVADIVYGGDNNRMVSATIKPVRTN